MAAHNAGRPMNYAQSDCALLKLSTEHHFPVLNYNALWAVALNASTAA